MKKLFILIAALFLLLIQWGCKKIETNISFESDVIQLPFEGGVFNFPIKSNVPSKSVITYDDPAESGWIFLLPTALYGDGVLELRVEPYSNIWSDRTALLTVNAGDIIKKIKITQSAKPALNLSPSNISTMLAANSFSVGIECKGDWSATVGADAASWCSLTNGTGSGVGSFTVDVAEMSTGVLRTAIVTVTTGELTDQLIVQQGIGVKINGLIWAHCNVAAPDVFASSPDNTGMLYQYDSKIGYDNSSPNTSDAPLGYVTGYVDTGYPEWKEENNPCPDGWRVPTKEEVDGILSMGYGWVEPTQTGLIRAGAVVGVSREETALATKDNFCGGILLPQSGYRENETGKQDVWWTACMTTCTRPNQNWDRYTLWTDYQNNIGWKEYTPNRAAYPVRCVRSAE